MIIERVHLIKKNNYLYMSPLIQHLLRTYGAAEIMSIKQSEVKS